MDFMPQAVIRNLEQLHTNIIFFFLLCVFFRRSGFCACRMNFLISIVYTHTTHGEKFTPVRAKKNALHHFQQSSQESLYSYIVPQLHIKHSNHNSI